jgi:hypothetical protein
VIIGQTPLTSALSGLLWTVSTLVAWTAGIGLLAPLIGIDRQQQRISAAASPAADPRASQVI